jgi:glycosyltransferase involved in cell wall biosynthesis
MKFVLILMIKNEEKILKRCLEAVEKIVDCFCICDTGSTDSTQEVAKEFLKTRTGCLTIEPWQNFGYNRTISFVNAQKYVKELDWNLKETYGILLDADMMFVPGKLKEQKLGAIGYKIIQKNANLEYYNTRIIRMDHPWKCLGVTHEYWDGQTDNLEKDVCFIDDRDDGGCKHDKFERDAKLLEDGLVKEPENVRYMFYLAQTYKCVGRYIDAIPMYKRRIKAGGWQEELWNSHYSIGECYFRLKNVSKFEDWMQRAHAYRPCRTESIYSLAKFFREVGQHYKSYHYIKIGLSTPFPKDDVLFIEADVYRGLFNYECSIVEFYIHPERCLRTTIDYMLKLGHFQDNCVSNMKFSIKPLKDAKYNKLELPSPFGEDFTPSAISICDYPMANVRYVNYWMENGDYHTKNSVPVQTENAYINLETNEVIVSMIDSSINLPRFETHVKGMEDIRLFKNDGRINFTATSVREYEKNAIRVITGNYNLNGNYENVKVLASPKSHHCEKNWLPISGVDMFIYEWHPFTIVNSESKILKMVETPPLFNVFKGSAPPIRFEDGWLSLVHFVEYCKPRRYYHCFVKHDNTLVPKKISIPFVFKDSGVEYCVSIRLVSNTIECYVSFSDKNPHKVTINLNSIEWINLGEN